MQNCGHKFKAISSVYDEQPSLRECLSRYSVADLRVIAKSYRYKGRTQYRKAELIDRLEQSILDYGELYELILSVDDSEFKNAEKTAKEINFVKSKNRLPHFLCFGYTFVLEVNGTIMNYMPPEVAELFESIDTHAFTKQRKHHQALWNYYRACVNLYGVVPVGKIVEIFNAQNRHQIDREELITVLYIFADKGKSMCVVDDWCVHCCLVGNGQLRYLIERSKDRMCAIPDRKELLSYTDREFDAAASDI